jgi:type I restriction enzyme S subunit
MNNSWPKVKLGEVINHRKDFVRIDDLSTYKRCRVQLHAKGIVLRDLVTGSELKTKEQQICRSGDFLVAEIDAKVGGYGIVPDELDGAIVSSHYFLFEVNRDRIDRNFLGYFVRTPNFFDQVSARGTTNYAAIRPSHVLDYQIPLPLLEEQQRIVAKIDELAAKIEEARVLQQRTMEDAWALLEFARANIFKKMSSSWKVQKLDEVAPINMGQSPPGESYNTFGDGIPLLNGPTEFGEKYPTPVQWTTAPTKLCKPGDILLCVRGATTGRVNWADKEYCIGRGLAALTPKSEVCVPEYVHDFVETQTQEMLGLAAGSTFPNLPGAKLKVLEIPVPPILEQRRVVAYLDSIQEKIKPLKHLQSQTAAELEALLPSILDKAFKGEF